MMTRQKQLKSLIRTRVERTGAAVLQGPVAASLNRQLVLAASANTGRAASTIRSEAVRLMRK